MKNYFECHITMLGDPKEIEPLVKNTGWKFSAINGDPVLGDGIKCYATMLFSSLLKDDSYCLNQLISTAVALEGLGVKVLRRKVERVIYDDRSSAVVCDGGCCAL